MLDRKNERDKWLEQVLADKLYNVQALTGDASFRHYYRLQTEDGVRILMDAPPDKEPLSAFLKIARLLKSSSIHAPKMYAVDEKKGFVLMEDLGDTHLLNAIDLESGNNKEDFYYTAIRQVLFMQTCPTDTLPLFDIPFMLKEMHLFTEWFLGAYLKLRLSDDEKEVIQTSCHALAHMIDVLPKAFIHRDYHSRNIMVLGDDALQDNSLGIIDFQDAMLGPITYDLVSLLKDCYIQFPREFVLRMVNYFYDLCPQKNTFSKEDCIKAFDLCGLQRHLKVLGIFSRLYLRDNKPNYLKDMPRTLHYVMDCLEQYEVFKPLYNFMRERVALPC